jgi:hypothetical protein
MKGLKKSQTFKWGVSCSMASGETFADWRSADWHYEKCGCAIWWLFINNFLSCDLRTCTCKKLPNCDSGMSPRICGFSICGIKKKICVPTFAIMYFLNKLTKPLNKVSKFQKLTCYSVTVCTVLRTEMRYNNSLLFGPQPPPPPPPRQRWS